jgi:addiction module RelE/StbE family toxin
MKIKFSKKFVKEYRRLPAQIQDATDKQIKFLLADSEHPSLDKKKMNDPRNIWRIKINKSYRITFQIEKDYYILRRIGRHNIIERP